MLILASCWPQVGLRANFGGKLELLDPEKKTKTAAVVAAEAALFLLGALAARFLLGALAASNSQLAELYFCVCMRIYIYIYNIHIYMCIYIYTCTYTFAWYMVHNTYIHAL